MRIPRSIQLYFETAVVHSMWRCHNKEFYLKANSVKDLLLNCIKETFKRKVHLFEKVKVHAYCVMNNHYHQLSTYSGGSRFLSEMMKYGHSLFGARFNRMFKRSGKVAEARPKTPMLEKDDCEMYVQFYIEANPIQAGICNLENLKNYKYSSYRYYAYGFRDEFTDILTEPVWYLALGKTARERQEKYRIYFQDFVNDRLRYKKIKDVILNLYIGKDAWVSTCIMQIQKNYKKQTLPIFETS